MSTKKIKRPYDEVTRSAVGWLKLNKAFLNSKLITKQMVAWKKELATKEEKDRFDAEMKEYLKEMIKTHFTH